MSDARGGDRKGPGFVLAGVSSAVVILIAALAITAVQTPPPAIAEIAPEAVQQIKEAPSEQTSDVGQGEGGAAGGGATTTTTTSPPTAAVATIAAGAPPPIERARVRRCVGDPPRQIEDPQSPPCVPYWQGDNGGATAKGVTRDTIKIALPTVHNAPELRPALEAFFNKRFEFYGRKIQLVSAGGGGDCVAFKAAAADLDAQGFFGVLDQNHDDASCFYTDLARRKIVGAFAPALYTERRLTELQPYVWQYLMANDRQFAAVGEMVCSRLVGHPAEFAKGLQKDQPRKIGIIVQFNTPDEEPDTSPLEQALQRCGSPAVSIYRMKQASDGNVASSQSAILTMQGKGVTSVICLCAIFQETFLGTYATSQTYFPEWILSSYGSNDFNFLIKTVGWPEAEQRTQILGASMQPRQANTDDQPFWWMIQEMNPNVNKKDLTSYGSSIQNAYRSMLLMASGLQLAGPNLTPESFQRGLHAARFPNPDHRNQAGKVGFLDNDHSMTNDTVEFWWSESEPSPDDVGSDGGSAGTLCYLDHAARRDNGRWPKGRGTFFDLPCFSGRNP